MTDKIRGSIGPDGPPWPVDLLADLHAGVLEPGRAAEVGARVAADPDARAVLAALDSVRADLGALREAPAPPMPEHFAARIDAALAEEARRAFATNTPPAGAPVIDLATARRKRGRMAAWGGGLLTAAAAAVAVAFVALPQDTPGTGVAAPSPTVSDGGTNAEPPLSVGRENIGESVNDVVDAEDYGPLGDRAGLDRCLDANAIDPASAQVVGVRPVTLDGKSGVMAIMLGEKAAQFRVLVVTPDCSALYNGLIN
ncbi:anti-sigma factor family protein [Actinokineospora fastidiosa]|uniref:Anti-sigma-M factor RsmA n=1 Tax=Actinokineospora fastidiosa TaxID=1816 RepID=A0A918L7Y1_9PSEU|nr:hypothetical protein [Actinokineospora fastidiosa]GGS19127.1 hypothetical protein GCM10010171_09640 [Actinokineospora fastidiosa]